MTPVEFEKLKNDIATAERDLARNEGTLESLMKNLQDRFKVKTLKEATSLVAILESESEAHKSEITELMRQIDAIVKVNG